MKSLYSIEAELKRFNHGYKVWVVLTGCVFAAVAAAWISLIFVLSDFNFHFEPGWCWGAWLLLLSAAGVVAGTTGLRLRQRLSDEQISILIEDHATHYDNRLINVVQFSRSDSARDRRFAVRLLAEEGCNFKGMRPWDIFPKWLIKSGFGALCLATVIAVVVFALNPHGSRTSLVRLWVPMAGVESITLTTITELFPGDTLVAKGATVEIRASFSGVTPPAPRVRLREGDGEAIEMPMAEWGAAAEDSSAFVAVTPPIYGEMTYSVRGGDARSRSHVIRAVSLPELEFWAADVKPPAYTGRQAYSLNEKTEAAEAVVGSEISFEARATLPLARVQVMQNRRQLASVAVSETTDFQITFTVPESTPLTLRLQATADLESHLTFAITLIPDRSPNVEVVGAKRFEVEPDSQLSLGFLAGDDYGLRMISLESIEADSGSVTIGAVEVPTPNRVAVEGEFTVDLAELGATRGSILKFRLSAVDNGPDAEARRGSSSVIEARVLTQEEVTKVRDEDRESARLTVAQLLKMQEENLRLSRERREELSAGSAVSESDARILLGAQRRIFDTADTLLNESRVLGHLRTVVMGLLNSEMPAAVRALENLLRAPRLEQRLPLDRTIKFEEKILAALKGLRDGLEVEYQYQDKADFLAQLENLIKRQRRIYKETTGAAESSGAAAAIIELAVHEDDLAAATTDFIDSAAEFKGEGEGDDFAQQLSEVVKLMRGEKLYERMLTVAEALENADLPAAVHGEKECLRVLMQALDIMNQWRVRKARAAITVAMETLKDMSDKLGRMEERQQQITEVTRDLTNREALAEEVRDELAKMDREQKAWGELVEEMAQDLYQFPELPVSNELTSRMRQVYEDVEQAADSAHAESVELAVQKEDSLLESIKNTRERVEDVEMWLPDVPDNIKWDLESFDETEFPDMPLVPLPDELEDIVGDLLEQEESIDEQSRDSTGNQMMADAEMGWDVKDGPMPSFSAKGKSGNTRPNDNEMTGRSGSGREGQANGELVEGKVQGLEGRETHARRTRDPLQKGQVEETEDSTLDAKATGGGKLGDESDKQGMFGKAPRRDLHMQRGRSHNLRQDTEALYATARLLYLDDTEALGAAAYEMRNVEMNNREIENIQSMHQRVVQQLRESRAVFDGPAMSMPVRSADDSAGASAGPADVDLNQINPRYRSVVSDYYKILGE